MRRTPNASPSSDARPISRSVWSARHSRALAACADRTTGINSCTGAKDKKGKAAAIIVNNGAEPLTVQLEINGPKSAPTAVLLDKQHLLEPADGLLKDGKLNLPPLSVALLKF